MSILEHIADGIEAAFEVAGTILEFALMLFVIVAVFGGIILGLIAFGYYVL